MKQLWTQISIYALTIGNCLVARCQHKEVDHWRTRLYIYITLTVIIIAVIVYDGVWNSKQQNNKADDVLTPIMARMSGRELSVWVLNAPSSFSWGLEFRSWSGYRLFCLRFLCGFLQSLQINAGILPQVRSRELPFAYISIHYALPFYL
jgi:hypothetical protein